MRKSLEKAPRLLRNDLLWKGPFSGEVDWLGPELGLSASTRGLPGAVNKGGVQVSEVAGGEAGLPAAARKSGHRKLWGGFLVFALCGRDQRKPLTKYWAFSVGLFSQPLLARGVPLLWDAGPFW